MRTQLGGRTPPNTMKPVLSEVLAKQQTAVYVKRDWVGSWILQPFLRPVEATELSFPSRSSATFEYTFGNISREGTGPIVLPDPFKNFGPLNSRDLFVTIRVFPPPDRLGRGRKGFNVWTGIIPADQLEILGNKPVLTGNQTIQAVGFEYLLERRRIEGAVVVKGKTLSGGETPIGRLGWTPIFNQTLKQGRQSFGNRSENPVDKDLGFGAPVPVSFAFGTDVDGDGDRFAWSVRQIIDYLLFWSHDEFLTSEPQFRLDGADPDNKLAVDPTVVFIDQIKPTLASEGYDIWMLLNRLLDRKRGIGAKFVVEFDSNGMPKPSVPIGIRIFPLTELPIKVGNFELPANPNRQQIKIDTDLDTEQAVVSIDASSSYDLVIVQGERTEVTFSVAFPTTAVLFGIAAIKEAWGDAVFTEYKNDTPAGRKRPKYDRLFRAFQISKKDGKAFDWKTAFNIFNLNPSFDQQANVNLATNAEHYNGMKRIMSRTNAFDPAAIVAEIGAEKEFLKPTAFVEVLDGTGAGTGVWVRANDTPKQDEILAQAPTAASVNRPNATVRPDDRDLTFRVSFSPNHALAKNHITDAELGTDADPAELSYDYEKMVVSLSLETDTRPKVIVSPTQFKTNRNRTLIIQVPDVHFWLVSPSTVVGLSASGSLQFHSGASIVRDDTDRLRQIAALATAWYGRDRHALTVTKTGLWDIHPLGTFIDAILTKQVVSEVFSPVSERSWNFDTQRTTIITGNLELDFARLG